MADMIKNLKKIEDKKNLQSARVGLLFALLFFVISIITNGFQEIIIRSPSAIIADGLSVIMGIIT